MRITEHFSLEEFRCRDGTPYPLEWVDNRLRPLCEVLEIVRKEVGGRPIRVVSGYRTASWNEKVGGAKNSKHLHGLAADIVVRDVSQWELYRVVTRVLDKTRHGLGGVGLYHTHVHLDLRLKFSRWAKV